LAQQVYALLHLPLEIEARKDVFDDPTLNEFRGLDGSGQLLGLSPCSRIAILQRSGQVGARDFGPGRLITHQCTSSVKGRFV
jgi:hypothetical protein